MRKTSLAAIDAAKPHPHVVLAASVRSDHVQAAFPPAFQADVLSLLIGKSVAAILADRSRAPHKLPPACTPPGTRNPTWLLADVLAWLASHREPAAEPPPRPRRAARRLLKTGRPTKVEQADAERLGITVKELRARQVEAGEGGAA